MLLLSLLLASQPPALEVRTLTIPGTTVTLELVKVPPPPGAEKPLWVGRTEVTWDQYDVFVYGLDVPGGESRGTGVDAVARPSKPYVPPDRGFGHHGYPAMGMSHQAAQAFCEWLSGKVLPATDGEVRGKELRPRFRLPTAEEWRHFALAGDPGLLSCEPEPDCLLEIGWFADNSERSTRPVASKAPNAFGLHDVHGNVAEWVLEWPPGQGESGDGTRPAAGDPPAGPHAGPDADPNASGSPPTQNAAEGSKASPATPRSRRPRAPKPMAKGGSYLDPASQCAVDHDLRQTSAWNQSDPQIPKSAWWLSDCSFVGFRVVLDEDSRTIVPDATAPDRPRGQEKEAAGQPERPASKSP